MFDTTTSRNFLAPRRQERKKKYFPVSELGVLCVFARVISFPILQTNIQPRISNMFG
jgi:hypothetical protein